jgi:hypothetical protein
MRGAAVSFGWPGAGPRVSVNAVPQALNQVHSQNFALTEFSELHQPQHLQLSHNTRRYRHPLLGSLAYRGGAMQEFIANILWAC